MVQLLHPYMTTGKTLALTICIFINFPGGSDGQESACNARVWSLGQEDPLEKGMAAHSSILVWGMDRGAWWATVHGLQRVGHNWANFTFVGKVMSLLFNMLSSFAIALLTRSKCLLISWLQSWCSVILESKKRKSTTASFFFPIYLPIYHFFGHIGMWGLTCQTRDRNW